MDIITRLMLIAKNRSLLVGASSTVTRTTSFENQGTGVLISPTHEECFGSYGEFTNGSVESYGNMIGSGETAPGGGDFALQGNDTNLFDFAMFSGNPGGTLAFYFSTDQTGSTWGPYQVRLKSGATTIDSATATIDDPDDLWPYVELDVPAGAGTYQIVLESALAGFSITDLVSYTTPS